MLDRMPKPGDYVKLAEWHGRVMDVYGTPEKYAIKVVLVKNPFQHNIPEIHTSDTLLTLAEFSTPEEAAKEIATRMKVLRTNLNRSLPEAMEFIFNV